MARLSFVSTINRIKASGLTQIYLLGGIVLLIVINEYIGDVLFFLISNQSIERLLSSAFNIALPFLYFPLLTLLIIKLIQRDFMIGLITFISGIVLFSRSFIIHDLTAIWITILVLAVTTGWGTYLIRINKPLVLNLPSIRYMDLLKKSLSNAVIIIFVCIFIIMYLHHSFAFSRTAKNLIGLLEAAPTIYILLMYYKEVFVNRSSDPS
ncbi:hypothetical protein HGA91_03340 [candidate division WWE3 bacterium]|nr:hypothetical protein [candidate division WWE3 bacterium]